jgi:hypothetical protein
MIDPNLTTGLASEPPAGLASRILNALRNVGFGVAGCLMMIALLLVVPVIFLKGALWVSEHFLPTLVVAGSIALAVDLVLLLPLALVKVLRPWCAGLILLSSFLFGLITWLVGFVLTYTLWGLGAVTLGLFFLGIGVVPFAFLATLFKGMWADFFTVVALVILTLGSRSVAFALDSDR